MSRGPWYLSAVIDGTQYFWNGSAWDTWPNRAQFTFANANKECSRILTHHHFVDTDDERVIPTVESE